MPGHDLCYERCADVTRAGGEDLIGTAPCYEQYLLIEQPLPWPANVEDLPLLAAVRESIDRAGRSIRLQAIVPHDGRGASSVRRVLQYARTNGMFVGFKLQEYLVATDEVVRLCGDLATGEEAQWRRFCVAVDDARRDLLVCTHGTHDVCCGTLGTRLHKGIPPGRPAIRIWRTSHIGGHRFAPTALAFPEGQYWGQLTAEAISALIDRHGDVRALEKHYRGSAGTASAAVQVVEREAFARLGWKWLSAAWSAHEVIRSDGSLSVLLHYLLPDGASGALAAVVRFEKEQAVPACRGPVSISAKKRGQPAIEMLWPIATG